MTRIFVNRQGQMGESVGQNGLLSAFAKLRDPTISVVMSVCLSVGMEQLDSHWTDFHEI